LKKLKQSLGTWIEHKSTGHCYALRKRERFWGVTPPTSGKWGIKHNEDCAVVTHGFFMHTLIRIMKNVGFKADKERVNYRNGEVILLTRGCER
jgi:hypothetical protein